jgi:hypothetical protein
MGRLAGFHYREIVKRLKAFGFVFDRQQREVMKSGTASAQIDTPLSQITVVTCPKVH